jgi:Protein of unknown function (DUF3102)
MDTMMSAELEPTGAADGDDVAARVSQLKDATNRYLADADPAGSTFVEKQWLAGKQLLELKKLVQYGEWKPWLAANIKGSYRTVTVCMQLAKNVQSSALLGKSVDATLQAIRDADRGQRRLGTISAADLTNILAVRAFADTGGATPGINCVRIEASESLILGVATDRFTLGVARGDYDGEPFPRLIQLDQVNDLVKLAEKIRFPSLVKVPILIDDDDQMEFRFPDETLRVRNVAADFPAWRQLIPDTDDLDPEPVGLNNSIRLNNVYQARFNAVNGSKDMETWRRRDGSTLIRIGDDFVGAIMGVSGSGAVWEPPKWLDA